MALDREPPERPMNSPFSPAPSALVSSRGSRTLRDVAGQMVVDLTAQVTTLISRVDRETNAAFLMPPAAPVQERAGGAAAYADRITVQQFHSKTAPAGRWT